MAEILMGTSEAGAVTLDLEVLAESRLLVLATSGGGKTGTAFTLCEQAVGMAQVIVLDPEGEFAPLRAEYPFLLVGPEGETPAAVETAALLARTLLEVGASAVIDLYEMKRRDKDEFVKRFLTAMDEAPKTLWPANQGRVTLVVVDEAQMFVPETGETPSVAADAVEALMTRGRKRGFAAALVTQRLAVMSKTAAAMCQNVLIGRTSQIDEERAAKQLRIGGKAAKEELFRTLSHLKAGRFYAYGMAFGLDTPTLFQVNRAATLPEKKNRTLQPPPPPESIKALLPKLAALPQEARREAETLESLRVEVASLQRQLEERGAVPMGMTEEIAELERKAGLYEEAERELEVLRPMKDKVDVADEALAESASMLNDLYEQIRHACERILQRRTELAAESFTPSGDETGDTPNIVRPERPTLPPRPSTATGSEPLMSAVVRPPAVAPFVMPIGDLSGAETNILTQLATLKTVGIVAPTRALTASLCGYSNPKSGGFSGPVGTLQRRGLVETGDGMLKLTAEGAAMVTVTGTVTNRDLHRKLEELLSGPEWTVLQELMKRYPAAVTRADLAAELGYSNHKSGGFSGPVGRLSSMGFIEVGAGTLAAAPTCWLPGRAPR